MPELFQVIKDPPPPGSGGTPIFCGKPTAWLGKGVYFWESFIENARQYGQTHCAEWGKENRCKGFAVYKVDVDYGDRCFNLVDGADDLRYVLDLYNSLKSKNVKGRPIRFFELIQIMRSDDEFRKEYDCVRSCPNGGLAPALSLEYTLPEDSIKAKFFFTPPIQVCFWQNAPKKESLVFVE